MSKRKFKAMSVQELEKALEKPANCKALAKYVHRHEINGFSKDAQVFIRSHQGFQAALREIIVVDVQKFGIVHLGNAVPKQFLAESGDPELRQALADCIKEIGPASLSRTQFDVLVYNDPLYREAMWEYGEKQKIIEQTPETQLRKETRSEGDLQGGKGKGKKKKKKRKEKKQQQHETNPVLRDINQFSSTHKVKTKSPLAAYIQAGKLSQFTQEQLTVFKQNETLKSDFIDYIAQFGFASPAPALQVTQAESLTQDFEGVRPQNIFKDIGPEHSLIEVTKLPKRNDINKLARLRQYQAQALVLARLIDSDEAFKEAACQFIKNQGVPGVGAFVLEFIIGKKPYCDALVIYIQQNGLQGFDLLVLDKVVESSELKKAVLEYIKNNGTVSLDENALEFLVLDPTLRAAIYSKAKANNFAGLSPVVLKALLAGEQLFREYIKDEVLTQSLKHESDLYYYLKDNNKRPDVEEFTQIVQFHQLYNQLLKLIDAGPHESFSPAALKVLIAHPGLKQATFAYVEENIIPGFYENTLGELKNNKALSQLFLSYLRERGISKFPNAALDLLSKDQAIFSAVAHYIEHHGIGNFNSAALKWLGTQKNLKIALNTYLENHGCGGFGQEALAFVKNDKSHKEALKTFIQTTGLLNLTRAELEVVGNGSTTEFLEPVTQYLTSENVFQWVRFDHKVLSNNQGLANALYLFIEETYVDLFDENALGGLKNNPAHFNGFIYYLKHQGLAQFEVYGLKVLLVAAQKDRQLALALAEAIKQPLADSAEGIGLHRIMQDKTLLALWLELVGQNKKVRCAFGEVLNVRNQKPGEARSSAYYLLQPDNYEHFQRVLTLAEKDVDLAEGVVEMWVTNVDGKKSGHEIVRDAILEQETNNAQQPQLPSNKQPGQFFNQKTGEDAVIKRIKRNKNYTKAGEKVLNKSGLKQSDYASSALTTKLRHAVTLSQDDKKIQKIEKYLVRYQRYLADKINALKPLNCSYLKHNRKTKEYGIVLKDSQKTKTDLVEFDLEIAVQKYNAVIKLQKSLVPKNNLETSYARLERFSKQYKRLKGVLAQNRDYKFVQALALLSVLPVFVKFFANLFNASKPKKERVLQKSPFSLFSSHGGALCDKIDEIDPTSVLKQQALG